MDALAQIGKRAAVTPSGTPFGTPAATPAGERANPMEIPGKQSAKKGSKLRQEQSDEEKDDENGPKDLQDATHRIVENLEDAKFADAEQGYDRPLGSSRPALIIVMGVASCGKSTIGMSLADALDIPFIDGDSLHPKTNIDKMSAGTPLTDEDRLPWLALIRSTAEKVCREDWVLKQRDIFGLSPTGGDGNLNRDAQDIASMAEWEFGEGWRWKKAKTPQNMGLRRPAVIFACSALKGWYRDILRGKVKVDLPTYDANGDETSETTIPPDQASMDTYFVYCKGSRELLQGRIAKRKGHFMGAQMLDSQLATLESPEGEPGVVTVDISKTPEAITQSAVEKVVGVAKC